MRIYIIFDLSIFRIEYNSDPSSRIASKSNRLSSVISSAGSLSIDIIYDSDNCNEDSLGYDSVENVDFIVGEGFAEKKSFVVGVSFIMEEDASENESLAVGVCFVVGEDASENEGLAVDEEGFAEHACNW